MLSNLKKLIKPLYLKTYDVINGFYFSRYTSINKDLFKKNNLLCSRLKGERVLILAPHIDDDIIGCGGAILKYLKDKKQVFICYLTDSGKLGSKENRNEISKERKNEALNVAENIGLTYENIIFLSGEDGNLTGSKISSLLLEVIKKISPDVIFTPCLLDTHADHYGATVKLCEAYDMSDEGDDLFKGISLYLYEAQSPLTEFYSNVCLDITDEMEKKIKLSKLYKSQPSDFKFMINQNRVNGKPFGSNRFIEAYIETTMSEYYNFYKKYYRALSEFYAVKNKLVPNGDSRDLIKSYRSSYKFKRALVKLKG